MTNDAGNTGSGGAQSDTDLIAINVDEAPQVTVNPSEGAVVVVNTNVTVTFNESVTLTGAWFTLNCATSGTRVSTGELTGTGITIIENTPDLVYTIDPTVDLAAGEACVLTIAAANVADNDTIDPPNTLVSDAVVNFSVDAAPAVTTTTPANGDGNVATNATITVNFSENVNATAGAFALDCGAGAIALSPATISNASISVLTPSTALPPTSTCTVTVAAANVTDADTIDNPDNLAANYVFSFTTTDPAPTVVSTVPTNAGTLSANGDISITFSEPVTFVDGSFTLACPGATAFTSSGSGTATATLNPSSNLPVGATCTVTVLAAGIADVDTIDPPDNMAAPYVFTFTPVNTAPTSTNDTATTNEDATLLLAAGDFGTYADADLDAFAGVRISTLESAGDLEFDSTGAGAWVDVTLNQDVIAAHLAAGRLRFVPDADATGSPYATIGFRVSDGIDVSIAAYTLSIDVLAANDAPVITVPGAQTTNEDTTHAVVGTSIADSDAGASPIEVQLAATNGTLTLAGTTGLAFTTGDGTADSTMTFSGTLANINVAIASLSFAPTANFNGAALLTITANDLGNTGPGGPQSDSDSVTINVIAIDDAPVANDLTPAAFNEDVQSVITLSYTDADGDLATACAVAAPTNVTITQACACAAGVCTVGVTGTPTNFNGSGSFTYTVTANAVLSNSATATLSILPVNDPPVAAAITPPAFDEDLQGLITLSYTDPDADLATTCAITAPTNVTVTQACACAAGVCTVGVTGAPLNYFGPASFAYTVTAAGQPSNSATATLTINPVNDAPVANPNTYDFIGNTELRVALPAGTTPNTPASTNPLANDTDLVEGNAFTVSSITVGGCTDNVAPLTCFDAGVGTVNMNADGSFSFVPVAGDVNTSESFLYRITDNGTPTPATSANAVITMNRSDRAWYVNNAAAAGGDGTSATPFDTLVEAQTASLVNDTIFVYFGNGTSSGMSAGIVLKNGQRLLGEHLGLSMPVAVNGGPNPTPLVSAAAGNRPLIDGTNAVSALDALPLVIGGLSLSGTTDAIDLTTNAGFPSAANVEIRDNVVRGGGVTGFDVNLGGSAGVNLSLHDNTFNAGANAIDIDETGTGSLTITAFDDNVVSGNVTGNGITIDNAIFDATPGNPFNQVSGGTTAIGASGNGVGASGMLLNNVVGDLSFTDLDVYASAGAGLSSVSTGVFNAASGTGFRFVVGSGVAVIEAAGGPAVDITRATIDLQPTSIRSTGSSGLGFRLDTVAGTFAAGAASVINTAASQAFVVSGGTANVNYAGTIASTTVQPVSISNNTAGTINLSGAISGTGLGVALSNNAGATINFSGGLALSTGTSAAFTATGPGPAATSGGTVSVTGTANTLTTTTGTALNVTNTTIGVSGLNFRSISANGGANGIVLNNTGATAGLTVTGDGTNTAVGGNASGGTIANTSGANGAIAGSGIYLNSTRNVVLRRMTINGTHQNFGIRGQAVDGFTLEYATVNGTFGNDAAGYGEGAIYFGNAVGTTGLTGSAAITNVVLGGGFGRNLSVVNTSGTLNRLVVTGSTFNQTAATSVGDNLAVEARTGATALNVTVNTSTFNGVAGDQIDATGQTGTSMDVIVNGNTLTNAHPLNAIGGGGVSLQSQGTAYRFDFLNNTLRGAHGSALTLFKAFDGVSFRGTVGNNVIGQVGVLGSGSVTGNGIFLSAAGNSDAQNIVLALTNNQIYGYSGNAAIYADNTGGTYNLDATITGNVADTPGPGAFAGLALSAGAPSSADDIDVCAQVGGAGALANNFANADPVNANDIIVGVSTGASSMRLPGYAGASLATVEALLLSQNNFASTAVSAYVDAPATAANFTGGASCQTP
ncbi:MAG TPA: Ig-like domain-containing protein [Patescibacteria group bacterium]|nr:Ig-like domain-containing protein [Patescibacteria group bacterium]